jgi:hypothetical protein
VRGAEEREHRHAPEDSQPDCAPRHFPNIVAAVRSPLDLLSGGVEMFSVQRAKCS